MSWLDALTVIALSVGLVVIASLLFRRVITRYLASMKPESPPLPCPKCGYDLRGNFFFCPECGTELLWGQLPGDQHDYDVMTRHRERQEWRMRARPLR